MMASAKGFFLFLLFFLLAARYAFAGTEPAARGKAVFAGKGCGACHRTVRPEAGFGRQAGGGEDVLLMKGPELWYAGSKFKPDFLEGWLQNPLPIRPFAYNSIKDRNPADHPRLSPGEASDVNAYLMTLGPSMEGGAIRPQRSEKAGVIFEKKLGCYGCHRIRQEGAVFGGVSGPTLVGAGRRLNAGWIYAFLNDPARYTPRMMMPVYTGMIEDRDMRALAAHVASFD